MLSSAHALSLGTAGSCVYPADVCACTRVCKGFGYSSMCGSFLVPHQADAWAGLCISGVACLNHRLLFLEDYKCGGCKQRPGGLELECRKKLRPWLQPMGQEWSPAPRGPSEMVGKKVVRKSGSGIWGLPLTQCCSVPEQGSESLLAQGGHAEGAGSGVTSQACSWIPREAEEPGKETEKAAPFPLPQRPLRLGEWLPV